MSENIRPQLIPDNLRRVGAALSVGLVSIFGVTHNSENPGVSPRNVQIGAMPQTFQHPQETRGQPSTEEIPSKVTKPQSELDSAAGLLLQGRIDPLTGTTTNRTESILQNTNPESLSVSSDIASVMEKNAVYLPAMQCSGFLVRNSQGTAVGVETAQHCNLRADSGTWVTTASGTAINMDRPITAETGDNLLDLKTVGTIDAFILNGLSDQKHDQALGVFAGHSAEEVQNAFNRSHLSDQEVEAIPKGATIYSSGWPVDQAKANGLLKRQNFAMTALGTRQMTMGNGEVLDLFIAAVPESQGGAVCSWGASGSEGFIMKQVINPDGSVTEEPFAIGTLSGFNDFGLLYNAHYPAGAAAEKKFIESTFGVSMDGYAAYCAFSYKVPNFKEGAFIAPVVIPNNEQIAQLATNFEESLLNPTISHPIINGLVEVIPQNRPPYFLNDPAYSYNSENHTLFLGYNGGNKIGNSALQVDRFTGNTELQELSVFSPDGTSLAPFLSSVPQSEITLGNAPAAGIVSNLGISFGQSLTAPRTALTEQSRLDPTVGGTGIGLYSDTMK